MRLALPKGNTTPQGTVHEIHTEWHQYLIPRMRFISIRPLSRPVGGKAVSNYVSVARYGWVAETP